MNDKKLGWVFAIDNNEGIPYLWCPHCGRKVSGKSVVFMPISLENCPDCGKPLHFGNIKEEDWVYLDSFYGEN